MNKNISQAKFDSICAKGRYQSDVIWWTATYWLWSFWLVAERESVF